MQFHKSHHSWDLVWFYAFPSLILQWVGFISLCKMHDNIFDSLSIHYESSYMVFPMKLQQMILEFPEFTEMERSLTMFEKKY